MNTKQEEEAAPRDTGRLESDPVTPALIREGGNRNQAPGWNYEADNFQKKTNMTKLWKAQLL